MLWEGKRKERSEYVKGWGGDFKDHGDSGLV
jgi:hypothetical protein